MFLDLSSDGVKALDFLVLNSSSLITCQIDSINEPKPALSATEEMFIQKNQNFFDVK